MSLADGVREKFDQLVLADGSTLHDVTVNRVDDAGISVSHRDGTRRIPFSNLSEEIRAKFKHQELAAGPPPPRFGDETVSLFSVISSSYMMDGSEHAAAKDIDLRLKELSLSDDPRIADAAREGITLRGMRQEQAAIRKGIESQMATGAVRLQAGLVFGSIFYAMSGDTPSLRDMTSMIEGEIGLNAKKITENCNRYLELQIDHLKRLKNLRDSLEATLSNEPAGDTSPFVFSYNLPGHLRILNNGDRNHYHLVIFVRANQTPPPDPSILEDTSTAMLPVVGYSAEFAIATGRRSELHRQIARLERGHFIYIPEIRAGSEAVVPFCDPQWVDNTESVTVTLSSDKTKLQNIKILGLDGFKRLRQQEEEKRAMEARKAEEAATPEPPRRRAQGTLRDNQRLEIRPGEKVEIK